LLEIKDIASEVERENVSAEFSPEEMLQIQERLSKLYTLEKKHQVTSVEALLEIQSALEQEVNRARNFSEHLEAAKQQLEQERKEMMKIASRLSEVRKKNRDKLALELQSLLKEVGIKDATLTIDQQEIAPGINGTDQVQLLFSANKGVAPQSLKNVASGGEFSRLMLCLKYVLAAKTSLPTIIFDEIDTGISGEVAIKVGRMMKQMGLQHQVIVITHLPQIAAMGETHYYVYKDSASERTVSSMKKLGEEERIKEIAQMIGGEKPSETALKNARELLSL
jgi:DNA repair protein RecN (Recombination protein N)